VRREGRGGRGGMKRVREDSVRGREKQLAYVIIYHLPEGHLLTQMVCGFTRG
jgi:hypothetical protein